MNLLVIQRKSSKPMYSTLVYVVNDSSEHPSPLQPRYLKLDFCFIDKLKKIRQQRTR